MGESLGGLAALDEAYLRPIGGKAAICGSLGTQKIERFWGHRSADGNSLEHIGSRGRIWVLALLLVNHGKVQVREYIPRALAKAIAAHALEDDPGACESLMRSVQQESADRGKPGSARSEVWQLLRDLISPAHSGGLPPETQSDAVLKMVSDYAHDELFGRHRERSALLARRAEFLAKVKGERNLLSALYADLAKEVSTSAADVAPVLHGGSTSRRRAAMAERMKSLPWQAQLGGIDEIISRDVLAERGLDRLIMPPTRDDQTDRTVKQIYNALRDGPRLIVLSGSPYLGKKAKVKMLLRRLAQPHDALLYPLEADNDAEPVNMPIRVFAVNGLHYRGLVDAVYDFLVDYDELFLRAQVGERDPVEDEDAETLPNSEYIQFDGKVELIHRYKHLPAVYVFTDVQAMEAKSARHAIRDMGIDQLIEALLDANPHTRVIVTTSEKVVEDRTGSGRLLLPVSIDAPHLDDLDRFVATDSWEKIPDALKKVPARATASAKIRGDDMVGLAAVLSIGFDRYGRGKPLTGDEFQAIKAFLNQPMDQRDAVRPALYAAIIRQLRELDLLHPIALIAASDDGVREKSLDEMMSRWRRHGADDPVPEYTSNAELRSKLLQLQQIAGRRFLRHGDMIRYDPEEYALREEHSEDDEVWEMDPLVSYGLLDAMRLCAPTIYFQAQRSLARIARARAQNKKVFMRGTRAVRVTEDSSRDIQAYQSLLAGIHFVPGRSYPIDGPPLRLSEGEIFSLDADRFNPARALRYAVYCLLREDIDHDYRLTMVFDEDELRLDLYLLLFQELGRMYPAQEGELQVPEILPGHFLRGVFSVEEQVELFVSASLSAFHCQRYDVIEALALHAERLAAELPNRQALLIRLWCSQIDSYLLLGGLNLGGGPGGDDPPSDLEQVFGFIGELRKNEFTPSFLPTDLDSAPLPEARPNIKAEMRLLAREAELCGMCDASRKRANELYERLRELEAWLSSSPGQHDPIVLSGRVARHYLRFLLDDAALGQGYSPADRSQNIVIGRARELLNVNMSRLRRFAGADRVGVMLDLSRLQMALGYLVAGMQYANEANSRAFSGSVSHASKLDVYAVLADAYLRLLEPALAGNPSSAPTYGIWLAAAHRAVRGLDLIATKLGYRPASVLAGAMRARCLIAECELLGRGWPYPRPRDEHPRRHAAEALAGARALADQIKMHSALALIDKIEARLEALKD